MTLTLRQTALLALMFAAVSLSLIVLDGHHKLDGLKGIASDVTAPISEALTDLGDRVAHRGSGGDPQLREELDRVIAERDALVSENARLKEMLRDLDQLREQLKLQDERPELTLVPADVIARDPQGREKYVIINRGSDDGVEVGMPVVSPNYLVGQIVSVEPKRAKVLLIIDTGFQMGARLQQTGDEGIVYGRWQLGGRIEMRHLSVDAQVSEDDLIVTSNKTARVPEGLVIGKVLSVKRDQLQNETELEVLPLVDFDNLQTVTVITGQSGR